MPVLAPPVTSVHKSFVEAMAEYAAEGRGGLDDNSNIGTDMRTYGPTWSTPAGFERYVGALRAQALEDTPRPATFVPTTVLWWTEGDTYLGRLNIRHRLAPALIGARNGHIGYDVRPSARRRGHATAMLAAALPLALAVGLDEVLVTCDADNVASRRTIERNGGVPAERIDEKLRFWIKTSGSAG
jgi:predicted acetyltransferase